MLEKQEDKVWGAPDCSHSLNSDGQNTCLDWFQQVLSQPSDMLNIIPGSTYLNVSFISQYLQMNKS